MNNHSNNAAGPGLDFNMKDFDALPVEIRRAMADANHNWNCTQVRKAITGRLKGTKRRKIPVATILDKIASNDARLAAEWYEKLSVGYRF